MFEFLKNLFTTQQISDEEFDRLIKEDNAKPCPNCGTYLPPEFWEEDNKCPQCKQRLDNITLND